MQHYSVVKTADKRKLVTVFEHCTQWLICYTPPTPIKAFREGEVEPVLGSLAGLDSTEAVAAEAAPINAITAFSWRFSGPVFFWDIITVVCPLFLLCTRMSANKHTHSHTMSNRQPDTVFLLYTSIHTPQVDTCYQIHKNICIYKHKYSLYLQCNICKHLPNHTNIHKHVKKRKGIYLRDGKLFFSVVGISQAFLLCCLKTSSTHDVHYNFEAFLIILCNQPRTLL